MLNLLVTLSLNFGQHIKKYVMKQTENKQCNTGLLTSTHRNWCEESESDMYILIIFHK